MFKNTKSMAVLANVVFWLTRIVLAVIAVAGAGLLVWAVGNACAADDDFRYGIIRIGAVLAFGVAAFVLMFGFVWSRKYLRMLKQKKTETAGAVELTQRGAAAGERGSKPCRCGLYSLGDKITCGCNAAGKGAGLSRKERPSPSKRDATL